VTILDEILKEIKEPDIDNKIRQICDRIAEEEKVKHSLPPEAPKGPNIFLVLETFPISNYDKNYTFLTLERESYGKYIIGVWKEIEIGKVRRVRVIDINEDDPKRIIRKYAEKYKVMTIKK